MPWARNTAKTLTSNGKQFTVTREMLTPVARDQSVKLKVTWCCRRNLSAFFKICFCFVLFFYITNHLMTGPLGFNVSRDEVEGNIEIRGNQNLLFPSGSVIKCLIFNNYSTSTHWIWDDKDFTIRRRRWRRQLEKSGSRFVVRRWRSRQNWDYDFMSKNANLGGHCRCFICPQEVFKTML